MKLFVRKIFLFVATILMLSAIADVLVSKGLKKSEKGHFYTLNHLMNDTLNNDVLIMGSSRATCSYSPMIIDSLLHVNSRNIAVSGQPFVISNLRYTIYKRKNDNPKMILLNIDYSELQAPNNGYERE